MFRAVQETVLSCALMLCLPSSLAMWGAFSFFSKNLYFYNFKLYCMEEQQAYRNFFGAGFSPEHSYIQTARVVAVEQESNNAAVKERILLVLSTETQS